VIDVWARLKVHQFHAFTRIGLGQSDESCLSYSRRLVTLVNPVCLAAIAEAQLVKLSRIKVPQAGASFTHVFTERNVVNPSSAIYEARQE